LTNSVSPLLEPIDVSAYQPSILSLGFDDISDLTYYQGRIWFLWHIYPTAAQKEQRGHFMGTLGLGCCEIDAQGNLSSVDLKKWPLPLPPDTIPSFAMALNPLYKIVTTCGGRLIAQITIRYEKAKSAPVSQSVIFSFSPQSHCWYVGAYGAATKRFRFHVIENVKDLSSDILAAAAISDKIIPYTHNEELYAGFDDTLYDASDWKRSAEVDRLLDLSFGQKIKVMLPYAAPFIFLNSPVPWDEQITNPLGGKAVYLPIYEGRVILFYNYEGLISSDDAGIFKNQDFKFRWPGLCIKKDDHYQLVFAIIPNQSASLKPKVLSFRLPAQKLESASMKHVCGQDIFSCVPGFCPKY